MPAHEDGSGDGWSRQSNVRMLAVASATLLLSGLLWVNYSAVLPTIVERWDLSGVHAGVVYGAFQAGYLLAVIPFGVLAGRYTSRLVIAIGATGAAAASLAFGVVANGVLVGTALRFLGGIGMAAVYIPGMQLVSEWFESARRGTAIGVYVGTFSVSGGLSFALTSWVASGFGWRSGIVVTSLLALCAGPIMLLFGRDDPSRESTEGGFDLSLLRNRSFLAGVGVYSAHNWELFGIQNWLPAFLVSTAAVSATATPVATAGLLAGLVTAVGGVGNLVGSWLSDRVGRLRVIVVALAASGTITLLLGGLVWESLVVLAGVVLGYGIVLTMDSAPTSTAITLVVDDEQLGTALSLQAFLGTLPGVVSPVLFGAALDAGGYALAMATLGAGALFGVCGVYFLWMTAGTGLRTETQPDVAD
ncbi:MFS transporter [Halovenus sp. HT40]|uniref:MFS transporter n=1 Tax=Halovenus sp. HT40 TaxID=3126691 RepID=UPI00300F565F